MAWDTKDDLKLSAEEIVSYGKSIARKGKDLQKLLKDEEGHPRDIEKTANLLKRGARYIAEQAENIADNVWDAYYEEDDES